MQEIIRGINEKMNFYSRISTKKEYDVLVVSYVLSIIIAIVVYHTGGTNKVYANFMYIPIALVASAYGK